MAKEAPFPRISNGSAKLAEIIQNNGCPTDEGRGCWQKLDLGGPWKNDCEMLMRSCWRRYPQMRPSAAEVSEKIGTLCCVAS